MIDALATVESQATPRRSAAGAVLGVLSVTLLGASFVWAHHGGPQADTLVVAWAVATLCALGVSIQVLGSYRLWPTRLPPASAAAAERPGDPGRTAGVANRAEGYDKHMLVDVIAALVLVLMAADCYRMLFIETEPQRDPVRRDDA